MPGMWYHFVQMLYLSVWWTGGRDVFVLQPETVTDIIAYYYKSYLFRLNMIGKDEIIQKIKKIIR